MITKTMSKLWLMKVQKGRLELLFCVTSAVLIGCDLQFNYLSNYRYIKMISEKNSRLGEPGDSEDYRDCSVGLFEVLCCHMEICKRVWEKHGSKVRPSRLFCNELVWIFGLPIWKQKQHQTDVFLVIDCAISSPSWPSLSSLAKCQIWSFYGKAQVANWEQVSVRALSFLQSDLVITQ